MNEPQRRHPDRFRLEEYVDETMELDEARSVAEHLAQCAECARYVERIQSLNRALAELSVEARQVPPILQRVTSEAGRQLLPARWVGRSRALLAASAVLIFAAGLATGAAMTRPPARETDPAPPALRPALEVQQAGTSYITALVRLAASSGGDEQAAAYGREVALATLYGAAAEAVDYLQPDPVATELLAVTRAARERVAQSPTTTRIP